MTDTAGLVTWLRARLDEDEQIARAAEDATSLSSGEWPFWIDRDGDHALNTAEWWRDRFHPHRQLAEVDAKRSILDRWEVSQDDNLSPDALIALDEVVRLLALPYADRPGYREEWRP